ncbi:putative secreted protein [Mycobacterium tuberculosis]|nr:putative secreted protein [Mycobacterium tuberculosis]
MTGTMRAPRTRGVLSGVLLILLGLWGGLLPFAGPYFGFGFAPDDTWVYTTDRLELSIAPAAAAVLGGLILLFSANRAFAMFGGWLAALGGAWFAVGPLLAALWDVPGIGAPLGTTEGQILAERLSGFTGLGVVIVFLAAFALGRFAVVGARERALPADPAPTGTTQPIVHGRYARENQPGPPRAGDRHVAGDQRYDR